MKRLLFPAFVACSVVVGLVLVTACDPDLGIVTTPGEAGGEAGTTDGPAAQPEQEGGPAAEGGGFEGGTAEAGAEHVIDGTNDFSAGDKLATTSPGYDAYVSWDDKKVYFGMSGSDLATTSSSKWVLVYVDGNPGNAGSATGIAYDCGGTCLAQQARLPFNAGYHLRWKLDGMYSNLQKWNGTEWVPVPGSITTFERKGTFWEVSLTRALLGSPAKLKLHMSMLKEEAGAEWTYAGVPSASFKDGPNPTFSKYYELDLSDTSKSASSYTPKP